MYSRKRTWSSSINRFNRKGKLYNLEFDIITYDKKERKTINSISELERGGNGYQGNNQGFHQQGYNQQQEFAQGNYGMNWYDKMRGQGFRGPELTDEQIEQIKAIHDKYELQVETLIINIEKVNLKIREEQLAEKTDWTAIEKLLDEKAEIKADLDLLKMKIRDEVEREVGVELPEPRNRGGQKGGRRGRR